jgi:hypothetical protein
MVAALGGPDNETLAKRLFVSKRTLEAAIGTKAPKRAKPIGRFLGRLGALARVEVRKTIDERDPKRGLFRKGKQLPFEIGRSGDRQACVALLSLLCEAKEPALSTPEECLGIPARVAALPAPEAPERWLADTDKGPAWHWLRVVRDGRAGVGGCRDEERRMTPHLGRPRLGPLRQSSASASGAVGAAPPPRAEAYQCSLTALTTAEPESSPICNETGIRFGPVRLIGHPTAPSW